MDEEVFGVSVQPDAAREFDGASGTPKAVPVSGFARRVFRLLESTEYRLCESGEDLEAIYNLRYKSYVLNGIIDPKSDQLYYDNIDEASNCRRYGIFVDGRLVSTVRIHILDRDNRISPSTIAFGDILNPRLDAGEVFVDPSRFATDPEVTVQNPLIPYITLRIAVAASVHYKANYCLSTVRVDHAGFYRKIFQSTKLGDARPYPGSKVPVIIYQGDVRVIPQIYRRYPFFRSTPVERTLLFERPSVGAHAPLTVLPSARLQHRAA